VKAIDLAKYTNPYRPGAGHRPPHLAGREAAQQDIETYFDQDPLLCNVVLTGLRGVGKTVLLDELRGPAAARRWFWVGTDLSESASISEDNLAVRLLADLAVVTSAFNITDRNQSGPGFANQTSIVVRRFDYAYLKNLYDSTPGLTMDKLKRVLEVSWDVLKSQGSRGIIFAYDEAQNLTDHSAKDQFPLSMLLDIFQSIQKKGIPYMLLLTGLPTLFPKLVEARTFSERMFHVITLDRLGAKDCEKAIEVPIARYPVKFTKEGLERIVEVSGGYPYFIQFICRELFDLLLRDEEIDEPRFLSIIAKLDTDFFAGRWAKATDRQRELMEVIALLPNSDAEFSVQEIVEKSKVISDKPFSGSHVNQMLGSLVAAGLIFKNRHGRYAFAVPLLSKFIMRQAEHAD
jgi:hypothetical protein